MTSPISDEADGPTLQAILDAVIERGEQQERTTAALNGLSLIMADNTRELRRVQNLMDTRPIKEDVAFNRRKNFVAMLFLILGVIFLHDEHVEHCGPGAEAKAIINYVLSTPGEVEIDELRKVGKDATPYQCGVTFPFHAHDDEEEWPTSANLLGLALYGGLALALGSWVGLAHRNLRVAKATERASEPLNRRNRGRDTKDSSQGL